LGGIPSGLVSRDGASLSRCLPCICFIKRFAVLGFGSNEFECYRKILQVFVRKWKKLAKNFSNPKGKKEGRKREVFFLRHYFKGDKVISMVKNLCIKNLIKTMYYVNNLNFLKKQKKVASYLLLFEVDSWRVS